MYSKLILVVVVPVIVWFFIKLIRSPRWDKFCKDLFAGKLDNQLDPKDTMKDINNAKNNLGEKVKQNAKESDKLKNQSDNINIFLGKDAVNTKNEKEGS